jgi:hypothetical protein
LIRLLLQFHQGSFQEQIRYLKTIPKLLNSHKNISFIVINGMD